MRNEDEFNGKTYWVVGASSGIGGAVSAKLLHAGAKVVLTARNEKGLAELAEECGGDAVVLPGDMLAAGDPERLCRSLAAAGQKVDGLIYCVGLGDKARLSQITLPMMQESMLGNCFAFVELVRLLNGQKSRSSPLRVVAISSLASGEFQKYLTLYAMGKAALEAAVRCLAAELGSRNVRINCIRPAFVDTPRLATLEELTGGVAQELKKSGYQPLGLIPPDHVASLILYLLSGPGESINGASIPINAGAPC